MGRPPVSRRRPEWSPYQLPHMRDQLRSVLEDSEQHAELLAQSARHTTSEALADGMRDAARAHAEAAWIARIADLYWITDAMATVALDASGDMPGFTGDDLPSTTGLLALEKPLPVVSTANIGGLRLRDPHTLTPDLEDWHEPVPVDGLLWHRRGDQIEIQVLCRASRLPRPLLYGITPLVPFMRVTMPMPSAFTDGTTYLTPDGVSLTGDTLGIAAFLAAAWHLMALPTVAAARDLNPSTGAIGPAAPSLPPQGGGVRLVDVRPMRYVASESKADSERVYRHRWVVRGHWRQQAVGPKRGERETIWVPSYIKGPENAPLLAAETVRIWRR